MSNKTKNRIIKIISHCVLLFGSFLMLVPFLWMLSSSFKDLGEVFVFPPKIFGKRLVWENYTNISSRFNYFAYFMNSVKVSAWVVFFQVFTSALAGYVFARLNFKGRDKIFMLYLGTMMIPFHVTVITNFLQMSSYGLVNTLWSLMIPPMVSAFGTFLMRQFFITVPRELDEAAKIDGCNPFQIFIQILLPMAKSTIATLVIFCYMNTWNDYFTPLIYINNAAKYTLPLGLASMKGMYSTDWPVLMASSTIAVMPVLIVFLFAQDAFVKGVMLSGMKD
ncbi:ABC transporter permease subunit [Anaerocolumna sedimenticola]|uniref:ABC transporter permease subunit n=1 Tax=Anaerocolumna sedimenticola TaxID=2696063 RepID=A0A6P1TIF5_9FIRM|nr:carbohydrate ABC transporter permease [Anaerocolumna sedimenticola]QHQ60990.1 ABC transporter permease subunit [Anaerocolumna sedimenticola]